MNKLIISETYINNNLVNSIVNKDNDLISNKLTLVSNQVNTLLTNYIKNEGTKFKQDDQSESIYENSDKE